MSKWNKPDIKLEVSDSIKETDAIGRNSITESAIATAFSEQKEWGKELLWSCKRIDITPENADSILNESLLQNEDIKSADLILVYRNNECYEKLNHDLESLLKDGKYRWKIVCIAIDKSIQKWDLSGSHLSILKQLLNEYRCITDHTVKEWTNTYNTEIYNIADNYGQPGDFNKVFKDKNKHWGVISHFTEQTQNIAEICDKNGIKNIYIVNKTSGNDVFLLEHGWICQNEDGSYRIFGRVKVYNTKEEYEEWVVIDEIFGSTSVVRWSYEHEEIKRDAERYWINMFPNQEVVFIDLDDLEWRKDEKVRSDQSLLIVDGHGEEVGEYFKNVIVYGWPHYYPNWWYEKFIHDWDIKLWLNAENILKYLEEKKW